MRANFLIVLAAGALALAPATAEASPNHCSPSYPVNVMAAMGDSISVACDAWDDACSTMGDYAGRLGNDWQSSWTVGDIATTTSPNGYSLRKHFSNNKGSPTYVYFPAGGGGNADYTAPGAGLDTDGVAGTEVYHYTSITGAFDSPIIAPINGSDWSNAPGQAQALVTACQQNSANCPQVVSVLFGGNSACKSSCSLVPSAATVNSQIDQTVSILSQLPAGTEVWVANMMDLTPFKSLLVNKSNWVFKNCQALWNIDTGQISVNTCDFSIFGFDICDVADWLVKLVAQFLDFLWDILIDVFQVKFPCWTMLNSNSTCQATSAALTQSVQVYLRSKICAGGVTSDAACMGTGTQYGNVKFYLARNTDNITFTDKMVSTLDCFHPNRKGQEAIADRVWSDMCATGINAPVNCSGPSPTTAASLGLVWDGTAGKYKNVLTVSSTCNRSRLRIFLRGTGNAQADIQTIESWNYSDNHSVTFNANTPYQYYYVYYELVDEFQTSGTTGSGGNAWIKGRKAPQDNQDPNTHVVSTHAGPTKVGTSYYYLY